MKKIKNQKTAIQKLENEKRRKQKLHHIHEKLNQVTVK